MMAAGLPGWDHDVSATCAQVGEHALIRWIASAVGSASSADVLLGIGDDAAVVVPRRNHVDVLTTDVQVDGVHFTRAFCGAADVGHRALHVNLSDVAAMGAQPRVALLSLGLPADLEARWVADLVTGLVTAARAARVQLVGQHLSGADAVCRRHGQWRCEAAPPASSQWRASGRRTLRERHRRRGCRRPCLVAIRDW